MIKNKEQKVQHGCFHFQINNTDVICYKFSIRGTHAQMVGQSFYKLTGALHLHRQLFNQPRHKLTGV